MWKSIYLRFPGSLKPSSSICYVLFSSEEKYFGALLLFHKSPIIQFIPNHTYHYTSHFYENSYWPRAFNQFTIIACELDMINVISAADIAFIMSSSTSAWLLSLLECSPRKQMAECFASVSEDKLCEKCIIKQLYWIRFSHDIINYQNLVSMLSASAFGFGR